MVEQVESIKFLTQDGTPLAVAALRFCLSHPAVSTVIPGMRNEGQAEINLAAGDQGRLPEDALKKLHELYAKGLLTS
jgi:aryl-alcohol dehydrogenase-like predicted oxidoreductase